MKMIQVDLSSFPPKEQEELRKKIMALAWDDYVMPNRPGLLTVMWNHTEPVEKVFPELAPYLAYQ